MKYNMEDLRLDLMDVENRAEWRRRTGEPVWLTPHPRDLNQPEGERERLAIQIEHFKKNA